MAAPFRGTGCMERTKSAMGILSTEKNLQPFPSLKVATPFLFQTDVLLFQKKESLFFLESGPHHPMRVVSFFFKRNLCITFLIYHKAACTFLSKETFMCAVWISLFLLHRLCILQKIDGCVLSTCRLQAAGCISSTQKGFPKCLDFHPIMGEDVYAKGSSPMWAFKSHTNLK